MNLAPSIDRAETPVFTDGLGERVIAADATTGEQLQILRLRPLLTAVPSFEFALRERTARLANFRHAYYARVRRIDRIAGTASLAVVSDHVEGTRLSEILRVAHARGLRLDTNAALCLIRQLVPAVALLHENARDASHGLIAPERIVVTPHARLVLVEHVLGSAIEQLQYTRDRLWQEFRIPMPSSAGLSRFDHRADVNGIGVTALSLVLGRPLAADEFPHAIPSLLSQARERSAYGDERPLSNAFRNWLGRTLQLDVRRGFASAAEALAALEETLASDTAYVAAPVALETFLSQYMAAMVEPVQAAPVLTIVATPAAVVPAAARPADAGAVRRIGPAAAGGDADDRNPHTAGEKLPAEAGGMTLVKNGKAAPGSRPAADAAGGPGHAGSSTPLPTLAELIPVSDLQPAGGRASAAPHVDEPVRTPAPAPEPVRAPAPLSDPEPLDRERASESGEPAPVPSNEDSDRLGAGESAGLMPAVSSASRAVTRRRLPRGRLVAAIAAALALTSLGAYGVRSYTGSDPVPQLGTLVVQSSPAGVEVFVDGVSRGMTPAQISLDPGSHILELRGRGVPRVIPFELAPGGQVSQYLEFADTPETGLLVVHSQPAGARVIVDGVPRGEAPLTLEGMSAGDHEVVLENDQGRSKHTVRVLSGTTASLVAPVIATAAEGPVSGWIGIDAPVMVEVREGGQLIGTSETDRLMLAAGRHNLEFVNATLGYREVRAVQVVPGKVTEVAVELPQGTINLNAIPWAEVFIDGKRVGETPIGNYQLPIGPHEIVFRHPELGERRHAVSVTAGAPVRLSVPMK